MSLRLPPRYYNTPTRARFRRHRLPAELWDTWELLNAIAWVNDYKFTPPVSWNDLAPYLDVEAQALGDRLARLETLGWLNVERKPGRKNVYTLHVPEDTADACGEATSLIPNRGEDSPREPLAAGADVLAPAEDTTVVHYSGRPDINAVAAGKDYLVFDELIFQGRIPAATGNIITRTREQVERIRDALWDLGLCEEDAQEEALRLRHVTAEYAEDWTIHRRLNSKQEGVDLFTGETTDQPKLGGGYYRMQIREKRTSPYTMSRAQRHDYRAKKDREWEENVTEERLEQTP